jgi:hypothetical protein
MNKHYVRDWSGNYDPAADRRAERLAIRGLVVVALFVACCWACGAYAQTAPTCVLTSSATKVVSPGSVTLGYSSTGAATCTATSSGNQTAWNGSKPLSGSQTLTGMKASSDYTLTCAAAQAINGTAALSWTPPTQNTDGTALTNLAGYDVLYGSSCTALSQTLTLKDPSLTSYQMQLPPGPYCFAMKSYNTNGDRSPAPGNTATKTVTVGPAPTCTSTVHVDVTVLPSPPALLTVDTTAYEINKTTDALALNAVGSVPLGVTCKPEYDANGLNVVPRDLVKFKTSTRPLVVVAKCG